MVGNAASGCGRSVPRGRGTAFQPRKRDEGIPVAAPAAPPGPFRGVLLADGADVGHDDALLELKRLLELDDRLFHVLFAQEQIGHNLVIIHELILWAFNGGQDIKGLVDHFQPVIEFAEIKLQHGVVRIPLQRLLINADDFARLPLF